MAGPGDAQPVGEPVGEALERQLPVAGLGAGVRGAGPHDRPEPGEEPGPLAGRRATGTAATSKTTSTAVSEVLACWPPGPPGAADPHHDLVEVDPARRADPQPARPHRGRRYPGRRPHAVRLPASRVRRAAIDSPERASRVAAP